jgi:hypothetical protein
VAAIFFLSRLRCKNKFDPRCGPVVKCWCCAPGAQVTGPAAPISFPEIRTSTAHIEGGGTFVTLKFERDYFYLTDNIESGCTSLRTLAIDRVKSLLERGIFDPLEIAGKGDVDDSELEDKHQRAILKPILHL